MTATLNYVFAPVPKNRSQGSNTPVLNVDATIVATTTADLATSVQTAAADSSVFLTGSDESVLARLVAIGGAVWLEFGTNPTAVAASVGAHYLPAGVQVEYVIPNGWKIAAIDA